MEKTQSNQLYFFKKVPKNYRSIVLFKQLFYFEKKATKKERVMFFILREAHNNRTVFLKSIINRLSWTKPCTIQEAQNIIGRLEENGLISIIKKCPACDTSFNFLPNYCRNCGYKFIKQKVTFNDNRQRPRYAIEITDKGKSYVKELIESYLYINSFFASWNKYLGSCSFENFILP
ncbi:MAG: hypothetical protein ACFFBV_13030 [Promethearchaeota archaeon]